MRFRKEAMLPALTFLLFSWNVEAQNSSNVEIDIHENVTLIQTAISPDIPEDMVAEYQKFLPIFKEVLEENTSDETDACRLTIRIEAGFREIGSAKVKRAVARITAYRRNSKQEYVGSFILHSYLTDGLVNREETEQFLKIQILDPAKCINSKS
jgi:hypothetical protein